MKIEDMIENYLLSMGQKINLESYTFIPKNNYDYKKKVKEETLKIGEHSVELSKTNLNSQELRKILKDARNNFNNSTTITGDVTASCKTIVTKSIVYFTDFLKYAYNNFDLNREVAEKFITLCNGAVDTLGRNIESTLAEYNIKMAEAQREGAAEAQSSLQASLEEINSKKSTYVTLDSYHDPIMGNRVIGSVSSGYSDKAFHEGMLIGARQAADIIGSIPVKIANDKAVEGLKKLRDKTAADFNELFVDLLSAKVKGSVNEDIINKQGSNISDNPTFYNNCYEAISSLKEEDLENFKKLTEFYGFNFEEEATNNAIENIIDNYNKNNSFDYNNGDALLAIYLSNDEYTLSKTLTEKILETLKAKIKKVKKNEIDEKLNKELEIIETCKYLKDSDIKKIKTEGKEIANTITDNIIKETKDKITTTILTIISTILLAVLEIVCINFIIKFSYIILDRALMVLILVPAIVIGIIVLLVKNLKNKNKILKSAIIIISIILSIYGKITLTKIDEFRKDKVLIKYDAIDVTFKWVTKGTPIDLTIPENQQGDEGVQGWANKEGKFYINGITATENTKLFLSEAAGTVANGFATVTFKFENGQPDFLYKQYVGSWINVPQDPYKEGYTFTGWSTGNYTPVIHKETLLQGDLVVYARYQKN